MLRTAIAYALFLPWTLFVMITGLPLSFVSPDLLHNYGRFWAKICLLIAGVRMEIEGQENIPTEGAHIYMPNHQSAFDILVLFAGLPDQFRWLAKQELFKIPLFGLCMRQCGYIPINRADRKKAVASMNKAAQRIHDGTSVIIFPEGTRSADGQLLPFKKGGFILAMQAQVPIIPVAIDGSCKVHRKRTWRVTPGTIRVTIFPPIPTADLSASERDALMEQVRQPISRALETQEGCS
ncbi:MAG: 1-acyl-sn-glycerol-3-phosphate acyltransferase [Desulfuromonadales bacterium]|nr:1-acyl-sn-glycerol-3-phosphate acyltransferase [Desulfuromonadales bacterium]NIR33247.1 1-acyl-sn-glycerol-3-phosphate acyltransferase [Desulfuromonadales bacterium]NIS43238.1 1-acyl-sn-glycerol-3-phosphate acyltransferase [Desulfuromonadales bacterium]